MRPEKWLLLSCQALDSKISSTSVTRPSSQRPFTTVVVPSDPSSLGLP